jgi:hypothetical protein
MAEMTKPTVQKAKKPHRCSWCWQLIEPGDQYKRYRYFSDGDAGTVKMHPECFDDMQTQASEWGHPFEWTPGEFERPAKETT